MGCTSSSSNAVKDPSKPQPHPPTPHPNAGNRNAFKDPTTTETPNANKGDKNLTISFIPDRSDPIASLQSPTRMVVENTPENFTFKKSENANQLVKKDEDSFQPIPGYVVKMLSINPTYEYNKIFFNIFHHPSFNAFPKEFILSQEQFIVYDNRNQECLAYNILLPTIHFEAMEADPAEKEKTLLKLIYFVNMQNPLARIDNSSIKFPKTTKGFVGNEIPFFIIPEVHRRKSLHHSSSEEKLSATAATATATATTRSDPHGSQATTTHKLSSIPTPTPADFIASLTDPSTSHHNTTNTNTTAVTHRSYSPASITPPNEAVAPVALTAPPKMVGWLRKRGHVVQNWKTRYFVLDNGFLTYFVDKLEVPPFGKTMKGQLCLAGYREAAVLGEDGQVDALKLQQFEETRSGFFQEGLKQPQNRRKSSGMFISEPQLRIHLVFVKGLVSEGQVEDLRQSMMNPTAGDAKKKTKEEDEEGPLYEFMMEASNLEEKFAWLAAIEAHTSYIESVANSGQFPTSSASLVGATEDSEVTRQLSVNPYSAPNSQLLLASSSNPPMSEGKSSSLTPTHSFLQEGEGGGKRQSIESSTSTSLSTPTTTLPMNANNKSGGARRVSVINASAANQKWKVFLERGEELVSTGLTGKPNPVGIQLIREIILVRAPAKDLTAEESQQIPVSKRLIYIDANTFEMKGEIRWIQTQKLPTVKKVNDQCFEIVDGKNKNYRFYPKDQKTVDDWVEILNTTPPF